MIDQARLDELAQDFGEEDLGGIIEVFLNETWDAINEMQSRLETWSAQERSDHFHFLKGCALNIGATQFGARCEVWERVAEPFKPEDYSQLRADFQAVCDELMGRSLRMSG